MTAMWVDLFPCSGLSPAKPKGFPSGLPSVAGRAASPAWAAERQRALAHPHLAWLPLSGLEAEDDRGGGLDTASSSPRGLAHR